MVPSISFSGRECRHADKIFAFPARTEFSVTTRSWSTIRPAMSPLPPSTALCRDSYLQLHLQQISEMSSTRRARHSSEVAGCAKTAG
jgi:hypothetical protein